MQIAVNEIVKRPNAKASGLLGGFFKFTVDGPVYGTTCKHVIAAVNCKIGDRILDNSNNTIGTLSHWIKLETNKPNRAEFALIKMDSNYNVVWTKSDNSFKLKGYAKPILGGEVNFPFENNTKYGRISDLRHLVKAIFDGVSYEFMCVEVTAQQNETFSKPGHSGGAVYLDGTLLGIIFAISLDGSRTFIIPYVGGILTVVNLNSYTF